MQDRRPKREKAASLRPHLTQTSLPATVDSIPAVTLPHPPCGIACASRGTPPLPWLLSPSQTPMLVC